MTRRARTIILAVTLILLTTVAVQAHDSIGNLVWSYKCPDGATVLTYEHPDGTTLVECFAFFRSDKR